VSGKRRGRVPAEAACEILHKAFLRERRERGWRRYDNPGDPRAQCGMSGRDATGVCAADIDDRTGE
jgi:hypothetical protein